MDLASQPDAHENPRRPVGPLLVAAAVISLVWAVVGVMLMTYGITYYWPDNVHVTYGFPSVFATHSLNTIAGPVDRWSVDLASLMIDLAFWSLGTVGVFLIAEYLFLRRTLPSGRRS